MFIWGVLLRVLHDTVCLERGGSTGQRTVPNRVRPDPVWQGWPSVGATLGQHRRRWPKYAPNAGLSSLLRACWIRLISQVYETLARCWFKVGPASRTLAQRWANALCLPWVLIPGRINLISCRTHAGTD